jgi:hypothetical protein
MDGALLILALCLAVIILSLYLSRNQNETILKQYGEIIYKKLGQYGKPEQYGRTSYTQTGYHVKSNAERKIADYLTWKNIRYVYEPVLRGGHYDHKIMHPDFYLPDYNVYVEYWGLVDLPDEGKKEQYIKKMRWKMAQYHSRNIKFISIYPSNLENFDMIFQWKFEKATGIKLPN